MELTTCNVKNPYVFVSYSRNNSESVYPDIAKLQSEGVNIWIDIKNMIGGKPVAQTDGIIRTRNCKAVLFYMCGSSVFSEYCLNELRVAKKYSKPIIPIHCFPVSGLEKTIIDLQQDLPQDQNEDKKIEVSDELIREVLKSPNGSEVISIPFDSAQHIDSIIEALLNNKSVSETITKPTQHPVSAHWQPVKPDDGKQTATPPESAGTEAPPIQTDEDTPDRKIIPYTLYGEKYSENQSDMMLRFFAQVLKRHTDKIADIPGRPNLKCVSKTDFSKPENQNDERGYKDTFRTCKYFTFDNGESVCVGTSLNIGAKQRAMATLLAVCGEDRSVFASDTVTLPEVVIRSDSAATGNKSVIRTDGKAASSRDFAYKIYGVEYIGNQSDMMLDLFEQVLKRHPDKVSEVFGKPNLANTSRIDFSKPENQNDERGYKDTFRTCKYFTFDNGESLCVGTSLSKDIKLKSISALLDICGEDYTILESQNIDMPAKTGARRSKAAVDFLS